MKNTQFHLFLMVLIIGFGVMGYVSYRSIDFSFDNSASASSSAAIIGTNPIETSTPNPSPEVSTVGDDVPSPVTVDTASGGASENESEVTPDTVKPAGNQNQKQLTSAQTDLVNALERLIKDDIRMKIGSKGTRVGTIQKFINMYENKNSTIDNKYGEGTKKSIEAFQKSTGDTVDGLADPGTYQKMIDWIKGSN